MSTARKTAIKETAKILAGLTLGVIIAQTIIYLIPIQVTLTVAMLGLLGWAGHMIYKSELDKAERLEKLNSKE